MSTDELRVLLVAPTQRDAEVTQSLLQRAALTCIVCHGLAPLLEELKGGVGTIVLTDRALFDPKLDAVLTWLDEQPKWSDVPVVLLTQVHPTASIASRVLERFRNLTVLDRPTSPRTMVSAVHAALRARQRQYQLREQLVAQRAAEEALREADRRKDEFLATLAHELRNPLAPLRTGLDVLRSAGANHEMLERVRVMMSRQVTQLVKLIDDLLDVSRIATGKVVLRRELVDMRQVVEAAIESSQPAVTSAHHTLTVTLPSRPVFVEADTSRLEQVICNVLNNACKYTPHGGQIHVALSYTPREATLRIVDNGLGIPAEMLPKVFEMFTQVDRNLDRAQGGLGIGLSLVKRLMELHGGKVLADSRGPNQGSTFSLVLPLQAQMATAQPVAAQSELSSSARRVLVVDDNVDAADALSMLLMTLGHTTRTAYSGEQALLMLREWSPDAVFCDLGMPGVSGFDVARAVQTGELASKPLLIALTGWGTEEDKRKTRESGFDFHITKPIAIADAENILAHLTSTAAH